MLTKKNFTKEWLEGQLAEMKKRKVKADPTLIEKNIHAFHLLEKLIENGMKFVFKGGTALILLIEEPVRFSIDIDIQMEPVDSYESLDAIFNKIVDEEGPFNRLEEDVRKANNIPKKHYKFYYDTITSKVNQYVLTRLSNNIDNQYIMTHN